MPAKAHQPAPSANKAGHRLACHPAHCRRPQMTGLRQQWVRRHKAASAAGAYAIRPQPCVPTSPATHRLLHNGRQHQAAPSEPPSVCARARICFGAGGIAPAADGGAATGCAADSKPCLIRAGRQHHRCFSLDHKGIELRYASDAIEIHDRIWQTVAAVLEHHQRNALAAV